MTELKKRREYAAWEWVLAGLILLVALYFFLRPAKPPVFTMAQMELCRSALREQASIPQTVNFHITGFAGEKSSSDGILRMRSDFSAKNAYGLELEFDGLCVFTGDTPEAIIRPKAR